MELVTGRPQDKRIDKEERVYDLLDQLNIDYQRLDHQEANTMEVCLEIEKNLKEKRQTILFLNRRGYSTFIMCRECGYTVKCKNCNISMTYHKSDNKLKLILNRLKNITKVAVRKDKQIPIILICENDMMLKYLYEMNILNAIIGKDRVKRKIYDLIKRPRTNKQAKEYYKIEPEVTKLKEKSSVKKVKEQTKNSTENAKNDLEKIVKYLNKVDLPKEKCVRKFESLFSNFNDNEIELIIKALSMRTRKLLKGESNKYIEFIKQKKDEKNNEKKSEVNIKNEDVEEKRRRGRPRKEENIEKEEKVTETTIKRKRGRPRKVQESEEQNDATVKVVEKNERNEVTIKSNKKKSNDEKNIEKISKKKNEKENTSEKDKSLDVKSSKNITKKNEGSKKDLNKNFANVESESNKENKKK